MILLDKYFTFYASNAKERDLWLRIFCRIIDVNNELFSEEDCLTHTTYQDFMHSKNINVVDEYKDKGNDKIGDEVFK